MKLDGKVALVTGAGRGIGRAIANALAREGCQLMLASRTESQLESAAEEIAAKGTDVDFLAVDVGEVPPVQALFTRLVDRFHRLDILVNNAGAFDGGPIDQLSIETWDRVIATNLRGPFLCTQAAMKIMKGQGGGRIINVGSISAQRVRPDTAPYCVSKHGIWGLTQATALEGRDHGITCCCLHPGNTRVERRMDSGLETDEEPMIEMEDVADVALLMATLPPNAQMMEAIVFPHQQLYVGRG